MFSISPERAKDVYKSGHIAQYPAGTSKIYSNMTPRSLKYANLPKDSDGRVVVLGLQGFIQDYLIEDWTQNFFNRDISEVLATYQRRIDGILGRDVVGTEHLRALHNLGYLPIRIKAIAEGSRIPTKIPLFTITNTKDEFFWLVNYLETVISMETWKTPTIATLAYEYRRLFIKYASLTGTPLGFTAVQGHDFSMRGLSGRGDSKIGIGHLASFIGTDTIPAIDFAEQYYAAEGLIGISVPASEHSVACCNIAAIEESLITTANSAGDGKFLAELEFFHRYISKIYPSGICSYVSDTFDFFRVVTEIASECKGDILARTPDALGFAKVVFRPDSGDPVEILCGEDIEIFQNLTEAADWARGSIWDEAEEACEGSHNRGMDSYTRLVEIDGQAYQLKFSVEYDRHDKTYYYADGISFKGAEPITLTPTQKGAVRCLWEIFGGTSTETGHKLLDSHVGLIYGDSITLSRAETILGRLAKMGFASGNVVFGIGSYTYQMVSRDTFGMAVKATWAEVGGAALDLFKDPATDDGTKKSARGLLRVAKEGDTYALYDQQTWEQESQGELRVVFEDGNLENFQTFSEIREILWPTK